MASFNTFFPHDVPAAGAGDSYSRGDVVMFLDGTTERVYIASATTTLSTPVVIGDFATNWVEITGGGVESINDLSDVNTSAGPVNGDILVWNPIVSEWVPGSTNAIVNVPTYPFQIVPVTTVRTQFSRDLTTASLFASVVDPDQPAGTPHTYQWSRAGIEMTGETDPTLAVTESGPYTVLVTDAQGNTATAGDVVTLNQRAVLALAITNTEVTTDDMITGTITVTDDDHPTDVTWQLQVDGVDAVTGTGNAAAQAFSIPTGAVGQRVLTLNAEDPQGAIAALAGMSVNVIQPLRTASFNGTNNIMGPTAGYTLSNLVQADQQVRIGSQYNFNDLFATANGGYQVDTAFATAGDALTGLQVDGGVTVNRTITGTVSAIVRTISLRVVNNLTGPAAGYTITNGGDRSLMATIGQTWNFIAPSVTPNAGFTIGGLNVDVTAGALTGTVGTDPVPEVVVTITGTVTASTFNATLSLSGAVPNVTATGGTLLASGTIGQPYTLELPTLTPDPGYLIGTAAYGGGAGALTGTFAAANIAVTRVLSGAAVAIQRTITFTFVNNIGGNGALGTGYTLTNTAQADQTGIIGDSWSFNNPGFTINSGFDGNINITLTSGTLTGTFGATDPINVIVTASGNVNAAVVPFTATGTRTSAAVIGSGGGTPVASGFDTNLAGPITVSAVPPNTPVDGASRLDSTNLGTSGGVTTTGAFGSCGGLSPDRDQVFAGASFTQNGTQTASTSTTALTRRIRYTNTVTASPVNAPARDFLVTLTGTIPTGATPPFTDEGQPASVQVAVRQAGDTANPVPTQRTPDGTVLTAGQTHTETTTVTAASTGSTTRACTNPTTGTGTYTFDVVSTATDVEVGALAVFSITNVDTSFDGGADADYQWTVSNGTITAGQGGTSIMVTAGSVGTLSATATNSFTGGEGSTFTHTDSASIPVVASGCTATVSATQGGNCNTGGIFPSEGTSFNYTSNAARTGFGTQGLSAGDTIPTFSLGAGSGTTCIAANNTFYLYPTDTSGVVCSGTGVRIISTGFSFFPVVRPTLALSTFTIS